MLMAAVIPAAGLVSCDKDSSEPGNGNQTDLTGGKFVIATTLSGSGTSTYVLYTSDTLDEGEIVPSEANGLYNDGATQWVFNGNQYLTGLTYNQGNDGGTRSYIMQDDETMKQRPKILSINRFSAYGTYNDYVISTAATAGTPVEGIGTPQVLSYTQIDLPAENTVRFTGTLENGSLENYLGNGEYVTLAGLEQSGSKLYAGLVPMGFSSYGTHVDGGKWVKEYQDLIKESSGGSGGGSYSSGEISGTVHANGCWVAIYDNINLENPVLAYTDKISYPAGRFRSQYYQTVWADENGDIYVFSPSYAKSMADNRQTTDRKAGVCRIKKGETQFDPDYYFDIESQTGGLSFMRCWYASGDAFLLVMYDKAIAPGATLNATGLAIFNSKTGKVQMVTGLPSTVSSIGKTIFAANGSVYIPVNVTDGDAAIYRIDTTTAVATKGITVKGASDITGFGYMKPLGK